MFPLPLLAEPIHMHTLCPAEAGDGTAIERPAAIANAIANLMIVRVE
jgi:hypothetical protein